jgi:Cu(I)/Ag(I) efflux system membrane fusion protein
MHGSQKVSIRGESMPKRILWVIVVIVAFGAGYYLSGKPGHHKEPAAPAKEPAAVAETAKKPAKVQWWTCSMHPQIKLPHPGKCPICFMDLIPLQSDTDEPAHSDSVHLTMSKEAKKLAEVETSPVKREQAKVTVTMVGMVAEDERRIAALTSRVDGRLDHVYVNFTGDHVSKGDPMVTIWSPTLIKAQVELFEALRGPTVEPEVVKGAEEKLVQYGLTMEQVKQIEEQKKAITSLTLRAPISGVVTQRMALLGQFVKEGTDMFIINDLSHVWVKMDAYETDMPWIRYGQDVTFTTPSIPGRTFKGKVLFIDPMLDQKTRSVKIRAEAENPDRELKPGMFVSAELEAEVDKDGRVIKSEWAGKYVCPMHPKDEASPVPGICPDSKLPLRPASSFGYTDDSHPQFPLVIPVTAPLITGKRSIVYVEVPGTDRPTYELREVQLGPKAGNKYLVYKGLKEGERVVTRGNFKIDSAMQILARPSMMSPPEQAEKPQQAVAQGSQPETEVIKKIQAPREFLNELTPAIEAYLKLKEALVDEKTQEAAAHAEQLKNLIQQANSYLLDDKAKGKWKDLTNTMIPALNEIAGEKDIAGMRKSFDPLSEAFAKSMMTFRHVAAHPLYLYFCPMASNNQGAYWIDGTEDRTNPYFGRKPVNGQDMLKCGELTETIPAESPSAPVAGKGADSSPPPQTGGKK